jgi:hypothetical protein
VEHKWMVTHVEVEGAIGVRLYRHQHHEDHRVAVGVGVREYNQRCVPIRASRRSRARPA